MLWVHVAADFKAIVSKQRKIQSGSSGISKERIKSRSPPPAIFAQVFIVKVLSLTSRVRPVLWDLRSDAFILASNCAQGRSARSIDDRYGLANRRVPAISVRLREGRGNGYALVRKRGDNPPWQISSMFYFTAQVKRGRLWVVGQFGFRRPPLEDTEAPRHLCPHASPGESCIFAPRRKLERSEIGVGDRDEEQG
jgi:hypothetical protein